MLGEARQRRRVSKRKANAHSALSVDAPHSLTCCFSAAFIPPSLIPPLPPLVPLHSEYISLVQKLHLFGCRVFPAKLAAAGYVTATATAGSTPVTTFMYASKCSCRRRAFSPAQAQRRRQQR